MTLDRGDRRRRAALFLIPALATLLAALALLAPPAVTPVLAAKAASWDRYDTTIDLHQDGTFSVTEDQVIRFSGGTFTEGYRVIPLARVDSISNIQVSEDSQPYQRSASSGTPNTFKASISGGQI